jgi:hypothetical protein
MELGNVLCKKKSMLTPDCLGVEEETTAAEKTSWLA